MTLESQENQMELRRQLLQRLRGRGARMPFEEAVKDFPMERINEPFPNGTSSPFGLLEHLRLGQLDMLEYIRNPSYQAPVWPAEFWVDRQATTTEWSAAVEGFLNDRSQLEEISQDSQTDLYAKVPRGEAGHTVLRSLLIITDHNSFHIGEFAAMRQVMGTWPAGRAP